MGRGRDTRRVEELGMCGLSPHFPTFLCPHISHFDRYLQIPPDYTQDLWEMWLSIYLNWIGRPDEYLVD